MTFSLRTESALKSGGRLHRRQRHQLEQVVLEDVPDRAGLLVEAGPTLDPHRLRDGDLHVVDELAVPDRLEDAVGEPQRGHVLHGLLAEVVIDPEDFLLGEPALEDLVQLLRRGEVVPERLLHDQACPARTVAALADLAHGDLERAGRNGEVVDAVALGASLPVDLAQRLGHAIGALLGGEVRGDVAGTVDEPLPDLGDERIAPVLLDALLHGCQERAGRLLVRATPTTAKCSGSRRR